MVLRDDSFAIHGRGHGYLKALSEPFEFRADLASDSAVAGENEDLFVVANGVCEDVGDLLDYGRVWPDRVYLQPDIMVVAY
jgi:hypothetical protein